MSVSLEKYKVTCLRHYYHWVLPQKKYVCLFLMKVFQNLNKGFNENNILLLIQTFRKRTENVSVTYCSN